ncbi:MAG: hypothetical protein AYK23_00920 [Candidatus Proteinoplasmatales archaeon SG8-5]|nr:MAG: hypothetical protein AYK23_00920 [Candidatus Proteinoplasmatales archaeon SG8-5]
MGVALVCVMGILVGVWYIGLDDADDDGLDFTISMEGTSFNEGNALNLTFHLTHDGDSNITVTRFWPGASLMINLVNSSGVKFDMRMVLGMIDLTAGYEVLPGQTYSHVMDLAEVLDPLAPDQYAINVTYRNYHTSEGSYRPGNCTMYHSNVLSFTIIEQPLPATVTFALPGNETVEFQCELADTPAERAEGLMYVESMPQDEGMLFVFDNPLQVSFWMKNTLIPLDMIFIDSNGVVVNVEEADPEPGVPDAQLTRYSSDGPILYVLEINQGLAASYGIESGIVSTITYQG